MQIMMLMILGIDSTGVTHLYMTRKSINPNMPVFDVDIQNHRIKKAILGLKIFNYCKNSDIGFEFLSMIVRNKKCTEHEDELRNTLAE